MSSLQQLDHKFGRTLSASLVLYRSLMGLIRSFEKQSKNKILLRSPPDYHNVGHFCSPSPRNEINFYKGFVPKQLIASVSLPESRCVSPNDLKSFIRTIFRASTASQINYHIDSKSYYNLLSHGFKAVRLLSEAICRSDCTSVTTTRGIKIIATSMEIDPNDRFIRRTRKGTDKHSFCYRLRVENHGSTLIQIVGRSIEVVGVSDGDGDGYGDNGRGKNNGGVLLRVPPLPAGAAAAKAASTKASTAPAAAVAAPYLPGLVGRQPFLRPGESFECISRIDLTLPMYLPMAASSTPGGGLSVPLLRGQVRVLQGVRTRPEAVHVQPPASAYAYAFSDHGQGQGQGQGHRGVKQQQGGVVIGPAQNSSSSKGGNSSNIISGGCGTGGGNRSSSTGRDGPHGDSDGDGNGFVLVFRPFDAKFGPMKLVQESTIANRQAGSEYGLSAGVEGRK